MRHSPQASTTKKKTIKPLSFLPWEKEGSYCTAMIWSSYAGESPKIFCRRRKNLLCFFPRTVENEESFLQYPAVAFSSNPLTKLEPTMFPEANLGNGTWCSSSSSLPVIRLVRKEAPCCFFSGTVFVVCHKEKGIQLSGVHGGGGIEDIGKRNKGF